MRPRNTYLVDFPLNNQSPTANRDKLFKHFLEVLRNLFECSFDRFVLALIQNFDELLDRLCGCIKVFATLDQLIPLFREVIVLLKGLLIDVRELLEAVVNFLQLLDQLRWVISSAWVARTRAK